MTAVAKLNVTAADTSVAFGKACAGMNGSSRAMTSVRTDGRPGFAAGARPISSASKSVAAHYDIIKRPHLRRRTRRSSRAAENARAAGASLVSEEVAV
jgi:hypothetical protein